MDLIKIERVNGCDVVDSRLIAVELGVQHKNFFQTIKDNQTDIEQDFGHLLFETETVQNSVGAVNEIKYAYLNEEQATYLMTLSRNTPKVKLLKRKLVKSFSVAKQIIAKQQKNIQELTLKLALANAEKDRAIAEKNLIDTRHLITCTCPEPIQQKILGYQVVKEVERVEVVIDSRTQKEYSGVGITYIAKSLGFKTTAQCWAWLESIGYGKDSEHWKTELTAISSAKLPREDFEYLKDVLAEDKNRQLFIGE